MFINFSNHRHVQWSEEQLEAARQYGEITDVPFPQVSPLASEDEIASLAEEYAEKILNLKPACVMCAGEFSLCFAVLKRLLAHRIKCVCACTSRETCEQTDAQGNVKKTSIFKFVRFREFQ